MRVLNADDLRWIAGGQPSHSGYADGETSTDSEGNTWTWETLNGQDGAPGSWIMSYNGDDENSSNSNGTCPDDRECTPYDNGNGDNDKFVVDQDGNLYLSDAWADKIANQEIDWFGVALDLSIIAAAGVATIGGGVVTAIATAYGIGAEYLRDIIDGDG
ncbi:hypothetical protein OVA03_07555 [Asticcacaulis sp. SL142]|uniref:hypothetical protein n=1 Tax=Asticcacaulis sp. SL142 TaxID=2995155 RepID=UPI00226D011C|nr:hypothetical protein [Asticcacaulis sp. SL142]WAC49745.1 hypothetical protein OVA03_07555 [Asticcacaulis sp. SL142]